MPKIGYNPKLFYGDGYLGLPTYGPFDRILITAAAPEIPKTLLGQLTIGGKLVAPVGKSGSQVMILMEKKGEEDFIKSEHGYFVFVPLVKGKK